VAGPSDAALRAFARLRGLRSLGSFAGDHLAALATLAAERRVDVGFPLYREGEASRDILVLLEGAAVVRVDTPLGPVRLASLVAGELAGELSFLDGQPREATVVATAEASLFVVPFPPVVALMQEDALFAVAVLRATWRSLAARLRQANATMMRIMSAEPAGPPAGAASASPSRAEATPPEKLGALHAAGLSAEGLELLAATMRSERFATDEAIVAEGSSGDVLYVVAEGRARVSRRLKDVGEEALLFLERGDVFGEIAFLDGAPRSADVRAHDGPCTVLSVKRERFEQFVLGNPAAARQLLGLVCRTLCERLRGMGRNLAAWHVMVGFGGPSDGGRLP